MLKKNLPWIVLIVVTITLIGMMMGSTTKHAISEIGYSDFISQVDSGRRSEEHTSELQSH